MEFRKIQFTGRSSYIISLPKRWIQENKLKQGDVIPLVMNPDGSITVLPKEPKDVSETKKLEISSTYSPDMAVRLVISAYIQGYDIFDIQLLDELPQYKIKIRKTVQLLPGMEIIADEPNRIVAKSLLADDEVNIDEILGRLKSIVLSMLEDLELMKQLEDKAVSRDIHDLENELDRFYFLALRAVNKLLSHRPTKETMPVKKSFDLLGMLFIVRNIERIGDHIYRISQNFDGDIEVEYLKGAFSEIIKQIKIRDLKKIDDIMYDLKERIKRIDYKKSIAMDSYRRILEYLENIGETIINMAMG